MRVLALAGELSGSNELPGALAQRAPDLTSLVLADTGHYAPEERPAEVAAAIAVLVAGGASTE